MWFGAFTGLGAFVWVVVVPIRQSVPPSLPQPRGGGRAVRPYAADSLLAIASKKDLFRPNRRPASVLYDPAHLVAPVTSPVVKPTLQLVGLVAGHEGSAVVEGFPGVDGWQVVRKGDVVSGLRVQTISAASVVIVGLDTIWVLRVREPWK